MLHVFHVDTGTMIELDMDLIGRWYVNYNFLI